QVGIEHLIPILPGNVEGRLPHIAARVVDQDVNCLERGECLLGHGGDAGLVPDVEFKSDRLPSHRANFLLKRKQVCLPAARQYKIRATSSQCASETLPQPATGSRD